MSGTQRNVVSLRSTKAKSKASGITPLQSTHVLSVCEDILCPHQSACLSQGLAVYHILGTYCSHKCAFCKGTERQQLPLDPAEPLNVALAVKHRQSKHVVLTSFSRDDLADDGADHIARTVNYVHEINPDTSVEVIIHNCPSNKNSLQTIIESSPEVITHNVRTVPRLHQALFDNTEYACSINFLENIKSINSDIVTKSGLTLGLGENNYEVLGVMSDLLDAGCNCITFGQHLPISRQQPLPSRYVSPWEFFEYQHLSMQMGYASARSGPFICNSYGALNMYREIAE